MSARINFTSTVLALTGTALAQRLAPVGTPLPEAIGLEAAGSCVSTRDGVVRADGADYTARFDRDGVVFTPALGRDAPRSFPMRLRLVAIERGAGSPLALAKNAAPQPTASAVHYDRGDDVHERWHVSPAGLELSYVFARPPTGPGDLVVRLRVDTDLDMVAPSADGGVYLQHAGHGGVHISGVTGIDAAGAHVRGSIECDGDGLVLRLPAAFVDTALYPLVLDPLIGTVLRPTSGNDGQPQLSYEAASQSYLLVFERATSAMDVDVLGQRLDIRGRALGPLLLIRTGQATIATRPVVCTVASRSRFVVAWREAVSILGPWRVAFAAVDQGGAVSSAAILSATVNVRTGPRIGGDNSTTGDNAILAWASASDVYTHSLQVPPSGAPVAVGGELVAGALIASGVDISRSGGLSGRWGLTYYLKSLSDHLYVQAIGRNGLRQGTRLSVHDVVGSSSTWPMAIDGDGSSFLVVYPFGGLRGQRVAWGGAGLTLDGGARQLTTESAQDSTVAWLGPKYLVAWSTSTGTQLDGAIHGIALHGSTCVPCSDPFAIDRPGHDVGVAIGPQRAAGSAAGDEALIAFVSADVTQPFQRTVFVQRFDAQTDGAVTNLGGACGRPFVAAVTGPVALGNSALEVRLTGVTGASAAVLDIGVPDGTPLPCGTCRIMLPLVQIAATIHADVAITPFPVPCEPGLIGGRLEVQFLVLDPGANVCPLVRDVAFSDRLELEFGH